MVTKDIPQAVQESLFPVEMPEFSDTVVLLDAIIGDEDAPELDPQFRDSVKRFGVINPVVLVPLPPNEDDLFKSVYRVEAGKRRVKAARLAGHLHIPARVLEHTMVNAEAITLLENHARSANPLAELAAIERLLEQGATPAQITQATGIPSGTLKKRLALRNLSPVLRAAAQEGKIAVSTMEAIAKLPERVQANLADVLTDQGTVTAGDVRAAKVARAQAAASTISFDSLLTPEVVTVPEWARRARSHVQAMLDGIPGEVPAGMQKALAKLLTQADTLAAVEVRDEVPGDGGC